MTNFRFHILLRISLAICFGIAAYLFAAETPYWLVSVWLVLFLILAIISLIRLVESSDRELANFLLSIKQNDFTSTYPQTKKQTKRLYHAFQLITSEFISLRSEKESSFHFLQTVVEHSGVPLIAYTVADEQITLANKAAKDLFGIPHFTRLSALDRISGDLVDKIRELKSNDKVLLRVELKGEVIYVSVVVRELVLQEKLNKVVALHNINAELDQKEIESWQKLMRVMTHEIKNSVIPISTLAEVITGMFDDHTKAGKRLRDLSEEDEEDLIVSIRTIEKRSKGLVKFVTSYGDMAKVPKPDCEETDLVELARSVVQLHERAFKKARIRLHVQTTHPKVMLSLDRQMIEQVLINLIKNAMEAFQQTKGFNDPEVKVEIRTSKSEVLLLVSDNGPGMDRETLGNIFVPFFTTKKEGSGIGLSYSRQVMRAHRGNISVRSQPGEGTVFELRFNSTQIQK